MALTFERDPSSFESSSELMFIVPTLTSVTNLFLAISARRNITIGRHGLIVEYGFKRGLLLPSVPVEENMDLAGYLEAVCIKAGMDGDAWRRSDVKLYTFEAQTFEESDLITE